MSFKLVQLKNLMNKQELIKKITSKKEFSRLPEKDVLLAFKKFDNKNYVDEEKVKLTRALLRKVFSGFTSRKLLSLKDKSSEWILRKHLSTRERLSYYKQIYKKFLINFDFGTGITVFDLGAGVNGFSFIYLREEIENVDYIGIEAIGQLSELMNSYFKKNKFKAKAMHMSLFELEELKKIIKRPKTQKIVFLFKTLDSLEMMERDYSKKLLKQIVPLVDLVVVSFATRSMVKRKKFKVKRNWIANFVKENFEFIDDFELGSERYLSFRK